MKQTNNKQTNLSKAFDNVRHVTLLLMLQKFGLGETVLQSTMVFQLPVQQVTTCPPPGTIYHV